MEPKIALVTGAARGLGLATAKKLKSMGYEVVVGVRDVSKFKEPGLTPIALDVSSDASVVAAAKEFASKWKRLDVLVNNAGIFIESYDPVAGSVLNTKTETVEKVFNTNTLGAFRVAQAFLPFLKESQSGRIVNVSSGLGQLTPMEAGFPAYRISKTAMNALTRILAAELAGTSIKVNSVCPGWVRTDMGGASAARSLEEGIAGIVWAATLPNDGPTGGNFRDGQPIEW